MPEVVQDYLINRGLSADDQDSYDKVEQAVEGYLRRWKLKSDNKTDGKSINSVLMPVNPEEESIN